MTREDQKGNNLKETRMSHGCLGNCNASISPLHSNSGAPLGMSWRGDREGREGGREGGREEEGSEEWMKGKVKGGREGGRREKHCERSTKVYNFYKLRLKNNACSTKKKQTHE